MAVMDDKINIWIKEEEPVSDVADSMFCEGPLSIDNCCVVMKEEPELNFDASGLEHNTVEDSSVISESTECTHIKQDVELDLEAEETEHFMPKRRFSSLWYHFKIKEEDRGECKYCKTIISIAGGSVANLKRHLLRKHPTVPLKKTGFPYICPSSRSAETVSSVSTASLQQYTLASAITANASATGSESISNVDPGLLNNLTCMTPAYVTPKTISKGVEKSPLTNFVNVIKPLPIHKSNEIDLQLLKMICKEYLPFSIVEDKEFRKFVSLLCPNYQLPSRKTLSTRLLPQLFHQLRTNLQERLNATAAVALTTDGWKSLNNQSFLEVTAHYLDQDTKLHSGVLGCLEFSPQHTAKNIADFLKKEVTNWSIQDKIVAVTTDNAANVVAAVKICKWPHVPCYAHTINLIVKSSIKPIEGVVKKVKSIVQYLKSSSFALNKLQECQEQMNLPILKLKQEAPTYWNSLFDMLVRVFKNKLPIISTLAVLGNNEHKLTQEEWEIIEHSIKLLQIFYEVTKEVSVEQTVSLPKTEVLTRSLVNFISKFKNQEGLPPVIVEVSERMKNVVEERLLNMSYIASQATLLDPRFKKNGFTTGNMKYTQSYNEIVNEIDRLLVQEEAGQLNSATYLVSGLQSSSSSSFPITTNFNLWEDFDSEVAKIIKTYDTKSLAVIEMDNFISEVLLPRYGDPLLWWEQRKLVYPHLYSLVLKRLCIPACSVPSDRIFSKAGQILTEKRSRLGASKVEQIIFINGNV